MDNFREEISAVLGARFYMYRVFHALTAAEPTEQSLNLLTSDVTEEAMNIFSLSYDKALLSELKEKAGDSDFLESLRWEYTRLFIGPNKLPAPIWESVYVTGERVILQESTLNVRKTYAKHGILPVKYPAVADDHIALELDFMATLSERTQDFFSDGDIDRVLALLSDQKDFLKEHLCVWIPKYTEEMRTAGNSVLYTAIAELLCDWLKIDSKSINEISRVL